MKIKKGLVIACIWMLLGCGQSFEDALQIICSSPDAVAEHDPAMRMLKLAEHLNRSVTNAEAKALIEGFGQMSPSQRAAALDAAAKKAGLSQCKLGDDYAQALPAAPAESANPIHRIPKEYEGALKRGAQHREDAVKEATE